MASSAMATCGARASGSEKTPTVLMPRRFAVRMMRHAISPRLATSSLLKSGIAAMSRVWRSLTRHPSSTQDSSSETTNTLSTHVATVLY